MSLITVRPVQFDLPAVVDRYWLGDSSFKTHLFNSFHITLPAVEHWMICHIKHRLKFITTPHLQQDVRGFIQQEAQHAVQHTRFWHTLRQQGYELEPLLRVEHWLLVQLNRLDWRLRLATIAGMEHLTALIAEVVLTSDLLAEAEPTLKAMFEWHAMEELEHKTVAYDVLQAATQSYLIRVTGLAIGGVFVLGLLNGCTAALLHHDRIFWRWSVWREAWQFWFGKEKVLLRALPHCLRYLQPKFHPVAKD